MLQKLSIALKFQGFESLRFVKINFAVDQKFLENLEKKIMKLQNFLPMKISDNKVSYL